MTPEEATEKLFEAAKSGNVAVAARAIAAGARVNTKDDHRLTPLHFAAGYDHTDLAELLIE